MIISFSAQTQSSDIAILCAKDILDFSSETSFREVKIHEA